MSFIYQHVTVWPDEYGKLADSGQRKGNGRQSLHVARWSRFIWRCALRWEML